MATTPEQDAAARAAAQAANVSVAQAIQAIAGLGADAPTSLRSALYHLGMAYTELGWADPATPYSVQAASPST